jgi:pimeloyl-ACP methyl ester carboxylesterase
MKRNIAGLCIVVLLGSSASCGYMAIGKRDNVYESRPSSAGGKTAEFNSAVIIGTVSCPRDRAVLVMAWNAARDGEGPVEHVFLNRPGRFMLYVPEGRFRVYAITDVDEDGFFTDDEICAVGGGDDGITVRAGDVAAGLVITGPAPKVRPPRKIAVRDDGSVPRQRSNGEIIKLYDEKFCQKNASVGWWKPTLFMKAFGANIYLTEPYDPKKIPVLFVHGAEGSPRNWAYFHFRLNGVRYQPWYFYYPSGIRLSLAARILYESLLDLRKKYGFTKICITAHSMGGLIARYLLCYHDLMRHGIEVKLFATLAAPWSGFESADLALQLPSKKLPSWIDVSTHSGFIQQALEGHLPPTVSHHLFYGKDDTVSKGRALDERVYAEAKGKHGFDVDHDTILSDRAVFVRYHEILSREMR